MPSQILTDAFVRAISPGDKLTEYWDTKISGLCLRVMPSGARTWNFRYRPKGSVSFKRTGGGRYPEVGLSAARAWAEALRVAVAGGGDPQGERRLKREAEARDLSFDALAGAYIERYAKPNKSSWEQDDLFLRVHVQPSWGARKAGKLTRGDAAALLDHIATKSPVSANRVQTILSKLFNWAIESGLLEMSPVARMKKRTREAPKDRTLSPDEIRVLCGAIGEGSVAEALRFILLTGLRPGEAAGLEIAEVKDADNGARARLEIRASRMKAGRPHVMPLAPMALGIVRRQLANRFEGQAHVFPSHFVERGGPVARHSMSQALKKIIGGLAAKEPGDEEAVASLKANQPTPHDFRRTVATGLAALGVLREDRLAVLAHAQSDVHGVHYDKYERLKEKRRALELWEQHVAEIIAPASPSENVVSIGGRR
ncbi:site-specific integrase [Methylocystis sp.]|uniref:tyrosine-type recombinase/integrase n=1 Tax=Methylocystis sp. TaxID=1911079 RepID=UPI0025F5FDFC|nr:site-specific integrase [Methylocystis sp.]